MTRSKKIFLVVVVLFFLFLIWLMYDISSRTTFPGSKNREKRAFLEYGQFHSSPNSAAYPA
jgi:hypothetical protein